MYLRNECVILDTGICYVKCNSACEKYFQEE